MTTLWGVSYLAWMAECLVIALVYLFVIPKSARLTHLKLPVRLILRYAHSLVWILLAAASLLAFTGYEDIGRIAAVAGFIVYLVFIGTLVVTRIKEYRKNSE